MKISASSRLALYFVIPFLAPFGERVTEWATAMRTVESVTFFEWLSPIIAGTVAGGIACRAFIDQSLSRNKKPDA